LLRRPYQERAFDRSCYIPVIADSGVAIAHYQILKAMEIGDCGLVDKAQLRGCRVNARSRFGRSTGNTAFPVVFGQRRSPGAFFDEPKAPLSQTELRLMSKLSTDERNSLRYYAESARVLHGSGRDVVHQHLLSAGYIEERSVNTTDSLIVVTQAGRRALGFRS
jgi:hypothetical protein